MTLALRREYIAAGMPLAAIKRLLPDTKSPQTGRREGSGTACLGMARNGGNDLRSAALGSERPIDDLATAQGVGLGLAVKLGQGARFDAQGDVDPADVVGKRGATSLGHAMTVQGL